jgi:hypothetical protein
MWWLRSRVETALLPTRRVVAQFDFEGARRGSFWLVMTRDEATLCLVDPGYAIDLLVSADLKAFFKVWGRRLTYGDALRSGVLSVKGIPSLTRAFPRWFGWVSPVRKSVPTGAQSAPTPSVQL